MHEPRPAPSNKAIARYQPVGAYLALDPTRGKRKATLETLAARTWNDEEGKPLVFTAETLRSWVRRYHRHGLAGLEDKPRPCPGIGCLPVAIVELACAMKQEVPARSLDRILRMLEGLGHIEPGSVSRSTLHRALQLHGLSARRSVIPDAQDLDRFEADSPNDLWQSDLLTGPWLPDPAKPGKVRRAYLYSFLDDHSRLILHGRFSFKGDLPALELVFRRAVQKYGKPRRVYYDNGSTYKSGHMRQVVAELGIHGIIFTQRKRPMGHGKIEALNRLINAAFIEEVAASSIRTLDALNEAWLAWSDLEYNRAKHGETGEVPLDRWKRGADKIRYAEEEALRRAFLWSEKRTPDKSGIFSLFNVKYQVGPALARKKVDLRYDPEQTEEIEVFFKGRFVERVQPFQVSAHRRPHAKPFAAPVATPAAPVADWLGHLVNERRKTGFVEPDPREEARREAARRQDLDQAVLSLLLDRLDPAVVDGPAVREFLHKYGPFDPDTAASTLDRLLATEPRDLPVQYYLDEIRKDQKGETP
jgi:putative transposase